ncbi:putative development/cell death domain-containing protein [Lupinus albus]|uniref:Putative development/cell death domain-containing protein n=1 Tax=Lupinus albus TaxID=3870 RepID=A0A6A4QAH5_LUPAL|nr:putative development/cell death domain-containing protein [Lupinus albus]
MFKVQMRVRLQCQTLPEDKFAQVIADNYFSHNHFWFELDHRQTNRLISLLVSVAFAPGISVPRYPMKRRNASESLPMKTLTVVKEENRDEKRLIYEKLKEFALSRESEDHSLPKIANGNPGQYSMCSVEKLMQEVQELMAFKKIQTQKNCYLEQKLVHFTIYILWYLSVVSSSLEPLSIWMACIKIYTP